MISPTLPVYNIEDFRILNQEEHFYVSGLSAHLKQFCFIHKPHKHDFYFCVLCTKGSGTHEIDFNTYDVTPGSVFTIAPGQAHTWKLSPDIEGYVFFHTGSFYDMHFTVERVKNYPFYCSVNNSSLILLKNEQKDKVEFIFKEILQEDGHDHLMKYQKLRSLLSSLYIELSRAYLPQKMTAAQNHGYLIKVRRLEELIDTYFKKMKSPGEYAGLMFMSEKHLNRICKDCLNKTVSELISDRIILEAKRLLLYADHSVAEVSAELGYFDHSYFSRMFKKKCGQTPVQFINRYHE